MRKWGQEFVSKSLGKTAGKKFEKIDEASEFLKDNEFKLLAHLRDRRELLEDKVIALFSPYALYDVLFVPVQDVVYGSEGLAIRSDMPLVFATFREGQVFQQTEQSQNLGVEVFIPYYYFTRFSYRKPHRKEEHYGYFGYFGDRLPQMVNLESPHKGFRFSPKKEITDEDVLRTNPQLYGKIAKRIRHDRPALPRLKRAVEDELVGRGIEATVKARVKSVGGIYSATQARSPVYEYRLGGMWDINGIRIVCKNPNDCYKALEAVYVLLDYFDKSAWDNIALPRQNGFQALRIQGIYWKRPVEIQIQTPKMEWNAEHGMASNYRETRWKL